MREPVSVVIPTLNEEHRIGPLIRRLQQIGVWQIIVADGGSADRTPQAAEELGAEVVPGPANRGLQQNLGARRATGSLLVFLHADTVLPEDFQELAWATVVRPGVVAGAFRLRLDAGGWQFRLIEKVVAVRSGLVHLPYGDQAIFLRPEVFWKVGGFRELPVMEDFDLVRRLQKLGRIEIAAGTAVTSARRWLQDGVWRVTWAHQLCLLGYYLRIDPHKLARLRRPPRVRHRGSEAAGGTDSRSSEASKQVPAAVAESSHQAMESLASLKPGKGAIIEKLTMDESDAVRLMEIGFIPGLAVACQRRVPFGDLLVFQVDGTQVALRRETAERILIRSRVAQ